MRGAKSKLKRDPLLLMQLAKHTRARERSSAITYIYLCLSMWEKAAFSRVPTNCCNRRLQRADLLMQTEKNTIHT